MLQSATDIKKKMTSNELCFIIVKSPSLNVKAQHNCAQLVSISLLSNFTVPCLIILHSTDIILHSMFTHESS